MWRCFHHRDWFWKFQLLLFLLSVCIEFVFSASIQNTFTRQKANQISRANVPPPNQQSSRFRSAPWESQSKYHPGPPKFLSRIAYNLYRKPYSIATNSANVIPAPSQLTALVQNKPSCTATNPCAAFGRLPDSSPGANLRFSNFAQGFSFSGKSPMFSLLRRPVPDIVGGRETTATTLTTPVSAAFISSTTPLSTTAAAPNDSRQFSKQTPLKNFFLLFGFNRNHIPRNEALWPVQSNQNSNDKLRQLFGW